MYIIGLLTPKDKLSSTVVADPFAAWQLPRTIIPAWPQVAVVVSLSEAVLRECLEQSIADEFLEPLGNVGVIAAERNGGRAARQKELPAWPVGSLQFQTQSEKPSHGVAVVLLRLDWPRPCLHLLPNVLDDVHSHVIPGTHLEFQPPTCESPSAHAGEGRLAKGRFDARRTARYSPRVVPAV